jgi:hypothetical protein
MTRTLNSWWRRRNYWIPILIIWVIGLAWSNLATAAAWPAPRPVLDQQINELIVLGSSSNSGQIFGVDLNQQAISNAIAWSLYKNPKVPIIQPFVEITPASLRIKAFIQIFGIRMPILVDLALHLQEGKPEIAILEIDAAGARLPDSIVAMLQDEVERQLNAVQSLPFHFSRLELQEGKLILEGSLK